MPPWPEAVNVRGAEAEIAVHESRGTSHGAADAEVVLIDAGEPRWSLPQFSLTAVAQSVRFGAPAKTVFVKDYRMYVFVVQAAADVGEVITAARPPVSTVISCRFRCQGIA
ncbi:hypothetical protein [Streptomyces sp. NPDC001100]